MRRIVQAAQAGVGLAAEAIEHHKQKKKASSPSPSALHHEDDLPPEYATLDPRGAEEYDSDDSDDFPEEADEDAWELDEAVDQDANQTLNLDQMPNSSADEQVVKEKNTIPARVERLLAKCAPPPPRVRGPDGRLIAALPCPVVVPQRRPKNKSRGFVRAYAPVLLEAGIDQDTFIQFLEEWDKSAQVESEHFTQLRTNRVG
jgi:hypothetical protein